MTRFCSAPERCHLLSHLVPLVLITLAMARRHVGPGGILSSFGFALNSGLAPDLSQENLALTCELKLSDKVT